MERVVQLTKLAVGVLVLASCIPAHAQTGDEVSATALARKARSEALLRQQGVPINQYLPVIEDESQVPRRTRAEIANRALALFAVAMKGEGVEEKVVRKFVADHDIDAYFSPHERAFFRSAKPTPEQRAQFSWRYEAAWVMLWALGYVHELDKPSAQCDVPAAAGIVMKRSHAQFVADAKPRAVPEILELADRIYRYRWALVDARLNGTQVTGLDPDVAVERHQALNWLIGYNGAEWDDVTTDT